MKTMLVVLAALVAAPVFAGQEPGARASRVAATA